MAEVFISYARANMEFARRLLDGLHEHVSEVWVDWAEIPPAADWWATIKEGIEAASSFICVISPDWALSPVCQAELAHAIQLKKRLIPILYQQFDTGNITAKISGVQDTVSGLSDDPVKLFNDNWRIVSRHNWIFYDISTPFEQFLSTIVRVIETDSEHTRKHTHYLVSAKKWDARGRKTEYLLRGEELQEAVVWLEQSEMKTPGPTDLHRQFIQEGYHLYLSQQQSLMARWKTMLRRVLPVGPRKVFLSYRRADAADACGRIYDRLKPVFGEKNVFLDVNTIDFGTDFSQYIQTALTECFVVLAIIGPKWLEILKERATSDDPDYVKIELEVALKRHHVSVIPLFVSGASSLDPDELPSSLKNLTLMNGTQIRAGRDFHKDMDDLIVQLKKLRTQAKQENTLS